jgi:hypothetical protein
MRKFLIFSICLAIILVTFCSCGSLIVEKVEVTIIDAEYTPARYQWVGKTFVTYPAQYMVCVEYNGEKYWYNDKELYDTCKNWIGRQRIFYWETCIYDDGRSHSDLKHPFE